MRPCKHATHKEKASRGKTHVMSSPILFDALVQTYFSRSSALKHVRLFPPSCFMHADFCTRGGVDGSLRCTDHQTNTPLPISPCPLPCTCLDDVHQACAVAHDEVQQDAPGQNEDGAVREIHQLHIQASDTIWEHRQNVPRGYWLLGSAVCV